MKIKVILKDISTSSIRKLLKQAHFSCMILLLSLNLACTDLETKRGPIESTSHSSTSIDNKSDDNHTIDQHGTTNYRVVSAKDICKAYPISNTSFISLASCVDSCNYYDECTTVVMTYDPISGLETSLVGVSTRVIVHPLYQDAEQEAIQNYGAEAWSHLHGYDVAVIQLQKAHDYSKTSVGVFSSTSFSGDLRLDQESVALDHFWNSGFVISPLKEAVSSQLCTAGQGLFNQDHTLIALSLHGNQQEQCRLQRIDVHNLFIRDAMQGKQEGSYEITYELDPMPEELASFFMDMPDEITETLDYKAREEEALSRAPTSCESEDEDYCDASIYMRCSNGSFSAFDCDQVGWGCEADDAFEINCYPIEE